jgi:hypothetical protein
MSLFVPCTGRVDAAAYGGGSAMVRIDPDKVVPLMDEADSQEYLEDNLR